MVTYVIAHHFLDSIHAFHDQIIVINAKHFERAKLIRRDQMSQLACLFIFLYRGVQTCSSFIHGSVAKIHQLAVNYIFSKNPVVSIRNDFIYYKFIFQPMYIETLFWFVYFKGCYNQPGKYPMSLAKVSVSDPKLPI